MMNDGNSAQSFQSLEGKIDFEKHTDYIVGLEEKTKTSDTLYFTDHKRLSGVYWAISSLCLINNLDALPKERILKYVLSCYSDEEGGFSGNVDQDVHILYTLSGIQILAIYDEISRVDVDTVAQYIAKLQNDDGSFCGDKWGEVDTRFSYCAVLTLKMIGRVDVIDGQKAIEYILKCQNFDGGFGCIPNAESHAGQVFCCVGSLTLLDYKMPLAQKEQLAFWLCQRQLPSGGFNGRPDKLHDVCYSWWVLSSLDMLHMIDFIDANMLASFILKCQHVEEGGIADRPHDIPDVFHTFFGLAGLSLLEYHHRAGADKQPDVALVFNEIDSAYALPGDVVRRLKGENLDK